MYMYMYMCMYTQLITYTIRPMFLSDGVIPPESSDTVQFLGELGNRYRCL